MKAHWSERFSSLSAFRTAGTALWIILGLLTAVPAANAVPSFARQTGAECTACHVGAYGPQLTPYGIMFKLGGYTDSDGQAGKIPLSAMLIGSVTHTAKDQAEAPTRFVKVNDNATFDEASLFLAGRLSEQLGAFAQATYDGNERNTAIDQLDLRFAHRTEVAGQETILGLSFNNNPGVQDPFNTLPVWSFPYSASAVGLGTGDAATLLNGGLEQRVAGLSAYAFWNNAVYAELGTYRSLSPTMQTKLGLGSAEDMGRLSRGTTYWRLAYLGELQSQVFSAGLFGLNTAIQPDRSASGSNRFDDVGVDASYQFLGTREHIVTLDTRYIHETQTRSQMVATGEADHRKGHLNEFMLNASYTYDQTWGFTAGRFAVRGNSDATLYGDGFADGSPNTSGYILEADWTPWGKESSWNAPWANLRLGAQYTMYDQFNGATNSYDGNGRDAKDNNTLYFFVWTSI